MKYLVIMLMLALSACASDKPTSKTYTGSPTEGTIRVIGTGPTVEEAKLNGFNTAIEIVVGSIVISDKESRNNQLIRDDIAKHSAGYIDDYTIINKHESDMRVTLVMDVVVKSSKIHERVLGNFKSESNLKGSALSQQLKTYMKDRESGDKLLNTVLNDYPSKAFNLTKGNTDFKLDGNRNAIFSTDFELAWNYKYLQALNEALTLTQDKQSDKIRQERIFVVSKDPDAWFLGDTSKYYFNDEIRANYIKQKFVGSITVVAQILDAEGKILFSGCSEPLWTGPAHVVEPQLIKGIYIFESSVWIKVSPNDKNYDKLNKVNKIELTYTNGKCLNF